jgi:DNA-directed RNA polymerase I subunit RPA43
LLVHRTFNVSIPRHHIPIDTWEFEYGPAENDPEFSPNSVPEVTGDKEGSEYNGAESGGRWIDKSTGEKIGSITGFLEFTVVG